MSDLLKEYIVVESVKDSESGIFLITNREKFITQKQCECYGDYGQKIGCDTAGCNCLDNHCSDIDRELIEAIQEKFWKKYTEFSQKSLWEYLTLNELSFSSLDELKEVIEELNKIYPDEKKDPEVLEDNYRQLPISETITFAEEWINDNENHTECVSWTFWNGSNFNTEILSHDYSEEVITVNELEEVQQQKIIEAYENANYSPYNEGVSIGEFKEYKIQKTQFSNDPWIAHVEIES